MADQNFRVKNGLTVGIGGSVITTSTNGNVGVGTTTPTSKLWVDGDGYFTGILTANRIFSSTYGEFVGGNVSGNDIVGTALSISGISTFNSVKISSGIVSSTTGTAVTFYGDFVGTASSAGYATTAFNLDTNAAANLSVSYASSTGIATNLKGGAVGNVLYQSAPNTTQFVTNGITGQVLLSNGDAAPSWGNVSAASGSFGGITVRDENDLVGTSSSIATLNFVGSNIKATATTGANGIATITISDNLVGSALSISGISTFNSVKISSGIVTSNIVGVSVTFYGDFVGTASTAGYATTAFNLNGTAEGDLRVSYASTAGYATTAFNLNGVVESNLNVAYATNAGIATDATKLQNSRTFEITGDIVASPISFDGTGNVSLAATIQPNSVALGTDTTGDYVQSISGTSNQITVTGGTGEGSTPTLSIPNQFTVPQDLTVIRDVQIDRNLNVNGNITIGGTTATLFTQTLSIYDPDIVLGYRTDAFGNDVSNDNTANHGGVALASTEGNPLVQLFIAGIETNPATYKKIMWFKAGEFAGLGTDAWLFNYAVGIGSTQFPTGTRLAAGSVQFTENDLAVVRNINASGISTFNSVKISSGIVTATSGVVTFYGDFVGTASTAGYATTAFNLDANAASNLNVAYASTAGYATTAFNLDANAASNLNVAYASTAGYATTAFNLDSNAASNLNVAYASKAGIATYTSEWILGANGISDYTFTGPGFIAATNDPILYLIRGQQYKFTNTMGAHPFRIQSTVNGSPGTQYNNGIVNNDVSNGTLTWDVQFDSPSILYYQCTAHGSMGGKIYIIDAGIGTDISINTTGIITANSFRGDGSQLSGLIAGVSISTNTTNQAQYLTYVTGTGSTTGFGVTTTGLVFNPSSNSLGIGTTNPTSKLTVQGNVLISGVTTSGITRISSSTASPNASTPVATLEAVGASSNYDIAIVPKGNGAIVANIPDGTSVGGNKRGTYAVDLQLSRSTATKVASGSYCFIGGGNGNTASLIYSVVTGGNSNTASSARCFIGGGETNTANASYGTIVGGQSNTASGSYSFIGGGDSHTASSDYATIAGGTSNTASGQYSSVLGGRFSIANKNYSSVIGGYGANTRNTNGAVAFAGANTTFGTGSGVALQQARFAILSKETTDTTLSVLTADGSASYTNNVLQVVTKSAYLVKGSVIAYSNASDIARAWEFTAAIKNTSGTPTLVGTPIINDIAYDSGASGWNLSITADAGTSSLKVEVTGQASTTIRWVTKIDSTEVAFQ